MKGKVALLFQDSPSSGLSLAVHLAKLGADVAVVCQHTDTEWARNTKNRVEAENQQCLIIPVHVTDEISSVEAVRHTIERFGRLDLFIDHSFPEEAHDKSNERLQRAHGVTDGNQQSPLANFEMLTAALDHMFDVNVTL